VRRRQIADDMTFSALAWGAWRLLDAAHLRGPQDLLRLIESFLELGITTVDHADIYGGYACEAVFGAALARDPGLRARMEIVTKCDIAAPAPARPANRIKHYDTSAGYIIAAAEASLGNLGIEQIDVLLLHRPDPLMDADDVAEAFTRLRADGKVRHFGVSNFTPCQFDLLQSRLDAPLVTNQVECSVLAGDAISDGTLDQMQRLRRVPMLWSPLGRLFTDEDDQIRRVRAALAAVARRTAIVDLATVATAWLFRLPSNPVVISGSMQTVHLASMAAATELVLERQDWFQIYEALRDEPVP